MSLTGDDWQAERYDAQAGAGKRTVQQPAQAAQLEPDTIDPDRSTFVSIFGRKGSGKSVRARTLFDEWPHPRMVIDVLGTVNPTRPDGLPVKATRTVPDAWPTEEHPEHGKVLAPVVWYVPDFGDPAFLQHVDDAVGLCYETGRTLCWLDEVHALAPVEKSSTMPQLQRALFAGRHRDLSFLFCGPRPRKIDSLIVAQSDHVLIYDLPLRQDREHLADTAGWDRQHLHWAWAQLRPFEYLWLNTKEHRLTHYDPVPLRQTARHRAR